MKTHKIPEPAMPFKWGQQAAMILVAAFAGAYEPVWLLYVGLARFAWCVLGGEAGKGLASLCFFAATWGFLVLAGPTERQCTDESSPAAVVMPAAAPAADETSGGGPMPKPSAATTALPQLTKAGRNRTSSAAW